MAAIILGRLPTADRTPHNRPFIPFRWYNLLHRPYTRRHSWEIDSRLWPAGQINMSAKWDEHPASRPSSFFVTISRGYTRSVPGTTKKWPFCKCSDLQCAFYVSGRTDALMSFALCCSRITRTDFRENPSSTPLHTGAFPNGAKSARLVSCMYALSTSISAR